MIVQRSYPRTREDLLSLVRERTAGAKSVVVQAGHFLLYYDRTEDQLLPCVASELVGPRQEPIRKAAGLFPILTWELGVELLNAVSAKDKFIMVLVNDWQYVPKDVPRARFFEQNPNIPAAFQSCLDTHGNDIKLLTPTQKRSLKQTEKLFSEHGLRKQYAKHVKDLIKRRELPANVELQANGEHLNCSLVDALGRKQEIYCTGKSENCTHEVAELIFSVNALAGCDAFINLYPLVCKEYVEAGTELSFELFKTPMKAVLNIGMTATGVLSEKDLLNSTAVIVQSPRRMD